MKFIDAVEKGEDVVEVSTSGDFLTSEYDASVSYEFDTDRTVLLFIDNMWFGPKDLDELIAFLNFAKTKLTND